jgi:hypothetical protein
MVKVHMHGNMWGPCASHTRVRFREGGVVQPQQPSALVVLWYQLNWYHNAWGAGLHAWLLKARAVYCADVG